MKKDTRKRNQKDYYNKPEVRKKYREHWVKYNKKRFVAKPWMKNYWTAWSRCNNPNLVHYKCYGGRGIKFLITELELKSLWERDKATEMKQPTLDRIDVDGNYERTNCRFIEMSENRKRRRPFKEWTENGKPIPAEKKECEDCKFYEICNKVNSANRKCCGFQPKECEHEWEKHCGYLFCKKCKTTTDKEPKPKDRIEEVNFKSNTETIAVLQIGDKLNELIRHINKES